MPLGRFGLSGYSSNQPNAGQNVQPGFGQPGFSQPGFTQPGLFNPVNFVPPVLQRLMPTNQNFPMPPGLQRLMGGRGPNYQGMPYGGGVGGQGPMPQAPTGPQSMGVNYTPDQPQKGGIKALISKFMSRRGR